MDQPRRVRRVILCLGFVMAFVTSIVTTASCSYTPRRSKLELPTPATTREAFESVRGHGGYSGITLVTDNATAWAVRWEMLKQADDTIDISYFILENDLFGHALLGNLYQRALEGKKIRLLIDGRGSLPFTMDRNARDLLEELVGTGNVQIRIYNPPVNQVLRSLAAVSAFPLMAGTHNKIFVVDHEKGLTGGRNIGATYFAENDVLAEAAYDSDLVVDGAAIREIEDAMDAEWRSGDNESILRDRVNSHPRSDELLMMYAAMDAWLRQQVPQGSEAEMIATLVKIAAGALRKPPKDETLHAVRAHLHELVRHHALLGTVPIEQGKLVRHDVDLRVITSYARLQGIDPDVNDALLRAIGSAQHDIVLQSPYLLLTPHLLKALEDASRRDVRITLLTNSPVSSDNVASQTLFVDSWTELEAAIPTLRIFVEPTERMMHAKRAIIDDELTLVGTYNLDPFSAYVNSEMFVAVWGAEFNAQNRVEIEEQKLQLVEYKIRRDPKTRQALRYPEGHDEAGDVIVEVGPQHHVPAKKLRQLKYWKPVIVATRGMWDFDVVAW